MKGTVKLLLLALGAGLVLASVGCAGVPGAPEEGDDVSAAVQQLDSVDGDGSGDGEEEEAGDETTGDGGEGGVLQTEEGADDTNTGPDPLPWRNRLQPRGGDDDDDTPTSPSMTHNTSGTPSTGNGGK
jgi:hypothetical protein